jgi:3'-5' exoribonuclease
MKTIYVKDLAPSMNITNEGFAIKSVEMSQTKDNKPFYKLILMDRTGEIKGQIWSDNLKRIEKNTLKAGNVILVDALIEDYKGVLQMNIFNAKKIDETSLSEYMEASDFKTDDLWEEFNSFIEKIKDSQIKSFIKNIFKDEETVRKYKTSPGAEFVHHAYRSGLIEHVLEMLNCAEPLKKFYPEANFDLITAGIILHDIGKLFELEPTGVSVQRTKEGYLIGHVIKSYEVLLKMGTELDENTLLNLKHIILSHHGVLEFGSPILPATIEAIIVTHLDQLSSKAKIFQKVIRKNSSNIQDFAEFDRITGSRIYLGNILKETLEDQEIL